MKHYRTVLLITLILMTSLEKVCSRRTIKNVFEALLCHTRCYSQFNCACEEEDWRSSEPQCIPFSWLCDAEPDCYNKADEIDCICPPDEFQCGSDHGGDAEEYRDVYNCVDFALAAGPMGCWKERLVRIKCGDVPAQCDGTIHCSDGADERNCPQCPSNLPKRCTCNNPDDFTCGRMGLSCYDDARTCDGNLDCYDGTDEEGCPACRSGLMTCDCYKTNPKSCFGRGCFLTSDLCNGYADCSDWSDEEGCKICRDGLLPCDCYKTNPKSCRGGGCFFMDDQCDGIFFCNDGSDENDCISCREDLFTCDCYKTNPKSCSGRGCIPKPNQCDGRADCSDGSDEEGCTCREDQFTCDCYKTNPKSCYGKGCISKSAQCDGSPHCSDGSDEEGCISKEGQFVCDCYKAEPKLCPETKWLPIRSFLDGARDCQDGSDEPTASFTKTKCRDCEVFIRRFTKVKQCEAYADCDTSTCITVPALNCTDNTKCNYSQVICTSRCSSVNEVQTCNSIFQCENGDLEMAYNFCDGNFHCVDESDEIGNQPGFKCSASFGRCVLPQRNLYDGVAQCEDGSDLCSEIPCFECLDHRLVISTTQLCDGIIDCFDLSDECLCEIHLRKSICEEMFVLDNSSQLICGNVNTQCNGVTSSSIQTAQCINQPNVFRQRSFTSTSQKLQSHISCQSKFEDISAVTCDGRPECRDLADECSCDNPPTYCSDGCHGFYPLGDRYCDGVIAEAWKVINDSSCPEGFDEKGCPHRFLCKADDFVSIDREKVCDGDVDCDDGSDEVNCTKNERDIIFSSQTEMIANDLLRHFFWFISVFILIGNSVVILLTARFLSKEKMSESKKFNHILMINLSVSDFFMGIYLLIISVKSVQYSGFYGDVDYEWRTSLECSIIGSMAVISSETSCFIMTIITAFRLFNVLNPFTARRASTLKWKLGILLAWSVSLILALIPVFEATSNYFVHEIWFSNQFTSSEGWNKTDIMTFACRLASLSKQPIENNGDTWQSTRKYLYKNFPEYSPLGKVGYYGETSICMPRIYASHGDQAWIYSLVIISFNFISFLFVAISYAVIYKKTSNRPIQTSKSGEQTTQMQRRFSRLIATDFACWIPICIMVYLKVGGLEISNLVYLITAGLLLPINSALNPLLYSPIVEKHLVKLCFR